MAVSEQMMAFTEQDAVMQKACDLTAASSAGPQLPSKALREVPTPVRQRQSRAFAGRPRAATFPVGGVGGACSDLWVAPGDSHGSYRERLQARGQEAMQRSSFLGGATPRTASMVSTPSPTPASVSSMMFMRPAGGADATRSGLGTASGLPPQMDAVPQQFDAHSQQPWDLPAGSPMGPSLMGTSPAGMEALPIGNGHLFAGGSPLGAEAMFAAAASVGGSPSAVPGIEGCQFFGGEAYQQPFYPILAPGSLPLAASPQQLQGPSATAWGVESCDPSPQAQWGSENGSPAFKCCAPWTQDGVMVALMPQAAQLNPEQIAEQLRAAAPCSYDD